MENTEAKTPRRRRLDQPAPPPYIVEPSAQHKQSIILVHGLGNNGHDFGDRLLTTGVCSDGRTLAQIFPAARFIFPTSRWRKMKAFRKATLTSWFDIASLHNPYLDGHRQVQGLEESCTEVIELVRQEVDAVGAENVILGGISQGMATSLTSLLLLGFPLAGYIGISGWLPFCPDMEQLLGSDKNESRDEEGDDVFGLENIGESNAMDPAGKVFEFAKDLLSLPEPTNTIKPAGSALSTPVFLGHGTADEKIKHEHGEWVGRVLRTMGFGVDSKSYQGLGHDYKIPEEIDDIVEFIQRRNGWGEKDQRGHHVDIQGLVEGATGLSIH